MAIENISDQNYEEIIKTGLVLVDFWAEWCAPCKMLSPILDELSNEINGVRFVKINTDENQDMAQKLGITGIPTLLLYKEGEIIERMHNIPKAQLNSILQKHL